MSTDNLASGWAKALGGDRKQFDMFFDKILDGFAYHKIVVDKTGKPIDYVFLEVNSAFERMTGFKREKIIGKRVTEVLPEFEKDPADWIGVYGRVALTGEPAEFENFAEALDKWYRVVAYCPMKGHFVSLFEDITERKKAEEALKRLNDELEERVQQRTALVSAERQRLYNVLEALPSYVILLDRDHHVTFANKVFRETFGEDHGRRCYEYLFNKDQECDNCETYKVFKENKPQHWYWTGPNEHDYDIYDFPFKEADGSMLILEMGIDITARKRAEAQALESARRLKDAERLAAIGATAGMVGHDIRNPLQAITSDVYLAKVELASVPDAECKANALESLTEIEKNISYINKIVQDLQDYARPLNPAAKEIDLQSLIEDLVKKNGIPEEVKVSVNVQKEGTSILADPDIVRRVLVNLVNNAVQAMPEGGKLTIRAAKEADDTLITVQDTGVGIPEESRDKLFTPLFTTKSKGQGFGLAVVKRMTEALGGTVTFESEMGKGTAFIIRLPPQKKISSK